MSIFENNSLLNILFLFLALFGIAIAFIFYFHSKKDKYLVYDIITIPIFKNIPQKFKKLKILYDQTETDSLVLTRLSFCNLGNETILPKDITSKEPIRIEFSDDTQILDTEIVYVSRDAVNSKLKITDDKIIFLLFDFLGKNDGFVLNIIHNYNSNYQISVKGIIIGDRNKIITKYLESSFIEWLTDKIISKVLPKNKYGEIIVALFLFPILLPFVVIIYLLEISFKYHNRLPKVFRMSFN